MHTIVGLRVTHLTSVERLALIGSEQRLLVPKLRYLAISLLLPVLVLVNGALGFTSYQWIINVGFFISVVSFNILVILMVANAARCGTRATQSTRLLGFAIVVVLCNLVLSLNVYQVIMRSGELVTAIVDANFSEPWSGVIHRFSELCQVAAAPLSEPALNGRLVLWIGLAFAILLGVKFTYLWQNADRTGTYLAAAIALGTACEALISPEASYLRSISWISESASAKYIHFWFGPIIGISAVMPSLLIRCVQGRFRHRL